MNALRGLGWKSNPASAKDLRSAHFFDRFGTRPREYRGLVKHRGPRLRQFGTSACVAFTGTRNLHIALSVLGIPGQLASPSFGYKVARRQEHAGTDIALLPPLTDHGSYPRFYLEGVRKVGFVPWEAHPFNPATINDAIPTDVIVNAYGQKGLSYYSLDDLGRSLVEGVKGALDRGYPVGFGMEVDRAFQEHTGSQPIVNIDDKEIVGGHMMSVLDVFDDMLLVDNWWGDDWGMDGEGWCLMDAELFVRRATDVYALAAVPSFAKA